MWDLAVGARSFDGRKADRLFCGSWLACEGGLTADHYSTDAPRPKCGSGLAREGGVSVCISVAAVTAAEGSALTAGHFWKDPKVTKRSSPHPSAPRLGSVCPHAGLNPWAAAMGHPWPSAANPASCRVTHGFKPAFGRRGLTGRLRSKSKAKSKADLLFCGSGLAREGGLTADHYPTDAPRPKCGSGLAREGGLTADHYPTDAPRPKCGSGLARDGGLAVDHYSTDAPRPKCGSGLAREGGLVVDHYPPDAPLPHARVKVSNVQQAEKGGFPCIS